MLIVFHVISIFSLALLLLAKYKLTDEETGCLRVGNLSLEAVELWDRAEKAGYMR